jgi:uncharacterized RDD family membrane protein YckC
MGIVDKKNFYFARRWHRITAFLIDIGILTSFGQIIKFFNWDWLYYVGYFGRFLGWGISILYFGILNSKFGNGQTIGKRVFKIFVQEKDGSFLTLRKSSIRAIILTSPIFFFGLDIPNLDEITILFIVAKMLAISISFALGFILLCNYDSGQGLHDLIIHSYVMNSPNIKVTDNTTISKNEWKFFYTVMVLLTMFTGFICIFFHVWRSYDDVKKHYALNETFLRFKNPEVVTEWIYFENQYQSDNEVYQSIYIWVNGKLDNIRPNELRELAADYAIDLRTDPNFEYDFASTSFFYYDSEIRLISGYDLLFAENWLEYKFKFSRKDWED